MRKRDRFVLFQIGGVAYYLMEVLWKGSSHWSMYLAGGVCFSCIGMVRRRFPQARMSVLCAMGSGIITLVEFVTGCYVNILLQLEVWDYSKLPMDVLGQICLPFSILWYFLSYLAIKADKLVCNKLLKVGSRKKRLLEEGLTSEEADLLLTRAKIK